MSEFIIRVLKWLASLVVAYFLLFVLIILFIAALGVAFEPPVRKVEPNSILVLDLGFRFDDQPHSDETSVILNMLVGEPYRQASVQQVLSAVERARKDGKVSGLLIRGNLLLDGSGGSLAGLREVRKALVRFAKDKPVYAFLEEDSLRDYYLKSAATEVIADPYSMVDFRGLRAERLYLGDAFEKVGIEVQVSSFEEFKTMAETYQRGSMSEAEREQLQDLIEEIWATMVSDIAASRGMEVASLNAVAESELFLYSREILDKGFADKEMSADLLVDHLVDKVGFDAVDDTFRQFDFLDYATMPPESAGSLPAIGTANQVAIIYFDGIMVGGESDLGLVGSDSINAALKEVREDDSIRAVVLRVNSPGGSASAASRMVREIELTKRAKPVVVSMGGVAASGGYMVAAPGEVIYAEPTTVTGSIGVVSMLPNIAGLAEKLAVNFDGVQTHQFAGAFTLARPKSEEEMRQIRALGEQTYDEFLTLVAVNRRFSPDQVRSVAKGRVWSGKAAIELGLVDEEGGLTDAIQRAADLAGIGNNYEISEYPEPLTLEQRIQRYFTGARLESTVGTATRHPFLKDLQEEFKRLSSLNDPYGQYAILPYTLVIR